MKTHILQPMSVLHVLWNEAKFAKQGIINRNMVYLLLRNTIQHIEVQTFGKKNLNMVSFSVTCSGSNLWKPVAGRAVFGGQVIGQALVAATNTRPEGHHVHSLHCYFLNAGKGHNWFVL